MADSDVFDVDALRDPHALLADHRPRAKPAPIRTPEIDCHGYVRFGEKRPNVSAERPPATGCVRAFSQIRDLSPVL
jgi:hypothetical protein